MQKSAPVLAAVVLTWLMAPALSCAADEPAPAPAGSQELKAFQSLRITDPRAGSYYCPVCELGLFPGVLVFVNDLDMVENRDSPTKPATSAPLSSLLKGLNDIGTKYPEARMTCCVIVVNDGGFRAALETQKPDPETQSETLDKAITAKDAQDKKLKDLAAQAGVKDLILSLGMLPADREAFHINPEDGVAVLVVNKQQVLKRLPFPKNKLTEADVKKVLEPVDALVAQAQQIATLKKKKQPAQP